MKALLRWLWFLLCLLPAITQKVEGQQGKEPAMREFRVESLNKSDPSLQWMSEYRQPFIYQIWWQEIAACEGLPLPWEKIRKVQFFQVNAPSFLPKDVGAVVYAVTYGDEEQVYIANPLIWNRAIVEHEVLHLLRMWAGDPTWFNHDPHWYGERCRVPASGEPPKNE